MPATLRLSEVMRVNVNAGYQRDRLAGRDYSSQKENGGPGHPVGARNSLGNWFADSTMSN